MHAQRHAQRASDLLTRADDREREHATAGAQAHALTSLALQLAAAPGPRHPIVMGAEAPERHCRAVALLLEAAEYIAAGDAAVLNPGDRAIATPAKALAVQALDLVNVAQVQVQR